MHIPNSRLAAQLSRRVIDGFFTDTAYLILKYPATSYDEYNNPVATEYEVEVRCSFTDSPAKETWRDYADIENIEAEIRVANIKVTKGDRVKIAGRFDTDTMTDKEYEVVGVRDRDVFGLVCALKAVSL